MFTSLNDLLTLLTLIAFPVALVHFFIKSRINEKIKNNKSIFKQIFIDYHDNIEE